MPERGDRGFGRAAEEGSTGMLQGPSPAQVREPEQAVFWMGGDPRWRAPANSTPLTRTVRADVCVVGGGFTGLWTALTIKRLSEAVDVVLIEREFCGSGGSGRNGGWLEGWQNSIARLTGQFGRDAASWLLTESLRSVGSIQEFVDENQIDCDLILGGGVLLATSEAQLRRLEAKTTAAASIARDEVLQVLTREEAKDMSGSPDVLGGIYLPQAGSVQPALLAQGLRKAAIEAGIRIFECTPMTRLERAVPATVETPLGSVIADQVVLASGSWLAAFAELRRTVFVIPAHIIATEPSNEHLSRLGWRCGRPFSDARTAVHYGQRTADDRIIFGRGGGRLGFGGRVIPQHFHDEAQSASIQTDLHKLFPIASDLSVEWCWGGPVDRVQFGLPWVGSLAPHANVHYGLGYSGNGVGPSHLIGRTLASVTLGLADEHATSPLVSEPPSYLPIEPFRSLGARSIRTAVERCERIEDEGRTPDSVSRFLRRGLDVSLPAVFRAMPLQRAKVRMAGRRR